MMVALVLGLVSATNAQLIVDAEQFKANPSAFMGKTVTIKNATLKEANCHTPKVSGTVTTPSGTAASAPVGVAGPTVGPAKSAYCNPLPNHTLTRWVLGPNNTVCVQVDAKVKPALDRVQAGAVVKSVTFRVTPTMYLATRIEP